MRVRTIGPIVALVVGGLIRPSPATAQWRLGVYMGGNHSAPADIHIVQPTAGTDLTYRHVGFDAEPFKAPQYYGWRLGHGFGKRWGLGWELEFTHLKLFARTDEVVPVSGVAGGVAVIGDQAMTAHVQRYSMSHGLNFILFNLTSRLPLGQTGRTAVVLRGGAGPTLPHAETKVEGVNREQYEWAGAGGNGSAGVEIRLTARLAAAVDYKITYATPTISIAGDGTGQTSAFSQQVAAGVTFRLSR